MKNKTGRSGRRRQRGATLVLVAAGLTVLLGAMALAIDMGILYVARNEAQRTADAAALAGAYAFVSSGCTSGGCMAGGQQEADARTKAKAVGGQNEILGQPVAILDEDIRFRYPNPQEPQITVTVRRTTERGTGVSTIFAKVLHILQANVAARATAEAYNGGVANTCIAPFLVPNCDPIHTDNPSNSDFCGSDVPAGPFVYQDSGNVVHGSPAPAGIFGEHWELHFGTGPSDSAVASQWYMLAMEGNSSGSDLRDFITRCYPKPISCGDVLQTYNGKSLGPLNQGVLERIHADGLGMNQGQDAIDTAKDPSQWITGGYNDTAFYGKTIEGRSDSMVTVPIYDGHPLSAGGEQVQVVGFMEMFLQDVEHKSYGEKGSYDVVNAVILNVSGCTPTSGGGETTATAGSPIAIRLIRE